MDRVIVTEHNIKWNIWIQRIKKSRGIGMKSKHGEEQIKSMKQLLILSVENQELDI